MTLVFLLGLLLQEPPEDPWEFAANVYAYRLREDRDYLQPTLTADHAGLHLEARYNYEDRDTGSAWIGWNAGLGDEVKLDVTPMLGGVFGRSAGVAPGAIATLTWWKLELYAEAEYVLHFHEHRDNFFYLWSELTIAPVDWLQVGLVAQRTKVFENDLDVQRGILARVWVKPMQFTAAYFNPDQHPVYVLGIGVSF